MGALGMKGGGPALGKAMQAAKSWQLAHPQGTRDECQEWLLASRESLGL